MPPSKTVSRHALNENWILETLTSTGEFCQTCTHGIVAMFDKEWIVLALRNSGLFFHGGNMSYVASLRAFLVTIARRMREWNARARQNNSRNHDDDDFYEIFMFGPHG